MKKKAKGRGGHGPRAAGVQTPQVLDRYSLYELCAQSPERDVRLLRAIYVNGAAMTAQGSRGSRALVFGEDFCGTAALSRTWVRLFHSDTAVAVDNDAACIERAIQDTSEGLDSITFHLDDVRHVRDKVDIIAVQNFSICELHERADLVSYLRHVRSRLRRSGCFVCDIYDGADRFTTGVLDDTMPGPGGESIYYEWEQREADPLTARVVNAMHFEVTAAGAGSRKTKKHATTKGMGSRRTPLPEMMLLRDAFVYDWRLWSVPELRDAMREAGFRETIVFPRTPEAIDSDGVAYAEPVTDPMELGDAFNVYVVGR